jgi:hypothetical protein
MIALCDTYYLRRRRLLTRARWTAYCVNQVVLKYLFRIFRQVGASYLVQGLGAILVIMANVLPLCCRGTTSEIYICDGLAGKPVGLPIALRLTTGRADWLNDTLVFTSDGGRPQIYKQNINNDTERFVLWQATLKIPYLGGRSLPPLVGA